MLTPDIDQLTQTLEAVIAEAAGSETIVHNLQLALGGASKQTWQFEAEIASGPQQGHHALIMRRHMAAEDSHIKITTNVLSLAAEFAVLQAAHASGVPCPKPYFYFDDLLGGPAIIMERLEGVTLGHKIVKEPGLAKARQKLPQQMGWALAAIHAVDAQAHGLTTHLPQPASGLTPAQTLIEQFERDLDFIDEPHPAIELALRWLRRNEPPPPTRLALVHGDFRMGNMIVNPAGLVSVLDWEFAHIGDPTEDVAWPMVRAWRFKQDRLRFGGISQPEAFVAAYREASGWEVDMGRVFYWEVVGNVNWAIVTLNQARRHLSGQEPNLEFASLGRMCTEVELEILSLIKQVGS